jgi:hypothetical protein
LIGVKKRPKTSLERVFQRPSYDTPRPHDFKGLINPLTKRVKEKKRKNCSSVCAILSCSSAAWWRYDGPQSEKLEDSNIVSLVKPVTGATAMTK